MQAITLAQAFIRTSLLIPVVSLASWLINNFCPLPSGLAYRIWAVIADCNTVACMRRLTLTRLW